METGPGRSFAELERLRVSELEQGSARELGADELSRYVRSRVRDRERRARLERGSPAAMDRDALIEELIWLGLPGEVLREAVPLCTTEQLAGTVLGCYGGRERYAELGFIDASVIGGDRGRRDRPVPSD